jgi:hypothetical protein
MRNPIEGVRWMRAGDFARLAEVSPRTVRDWCAKRKIPAARRGPWMYFVNINALRDLADDEFRMLYETVVLNMARESSAFAKAG